MPARQAKSVIVDLIHLLYRLKIKKKLSDPNVIDRYTLRRLGMDVQAKDEQL